MSRLYPLRTYHGFTPASLPGLVGWWSAESGVTASGSSVSRWANQASTGSGYDWTQGTSGNRPTRNLSAINGYPTIQGDGVDDFMELTGTGLNIFRNISATTIFFVAALPPAQLANYGNLGASTGTSSTNSRFSINNTLTLQQSVIARRLDSDSSTNSASSDYAYETPGSYKIVTMLPNWGTGTIGVLMNGALVLNTGFTSTGSTSDTASQVVKLFSATNGANSSPIAFAEILIYQGALGTTARAQVESYLANKYQICKKYLVTDGDSGTAGGFSVVLIDKWQRWPSQLNSNLAKQIGMVNYAVSGNTILDRDNAAPTGLDVFTFPPYTTERILWLWAGSNDMTLGATPAQTYDRLKTYLTNRYNAGNFDSIGYATPMTRYNTNTMTDMTPTIQTYNDLVRAGWNNGTGELATNYHVKYFLDIGADPRFDDVNDTLNTANYQADRTHLVQGSGTGPTATGYAAIADLVRNALGL